MMRRNTQTRPRRKSVTRSRSQNPAAAWCSIVRNQIVWVTAAIPDAQDAHNAAFHPIDDPVLTLHDVTIAAFGIKVGGDAPEVWKLRQQAHRVLHLVSELHRRRPIPLANP